MIFGCWLDARDLKKKNIGGPVIKLDHTGNVFYTTTVLKKRIRGRRYDQSLDLGKLDTLKRGLERGRSRVFQPSYLQRMVL